MSESGYVSQSSKNLDLIIKIPKMTYEEISNARNKSSERMPRLSILQLHGAGSAPRREGSFFFKGMWIPYVQPDKKRESISVVSDEEKRAQENWAKVKQRLRTNSIARMFARALRKKMGVEDNHSD